MAERLRVLGVFIEVMGKNEKTKMALLKLHTYLSTATVVQLYNHLKTKYFVYAIGQAQKKNTVSCNNYCMISMFIEETG